MPILSQYLTAAAWGRQRSSWAGMMKGIGQIFTCQSLKSVSQSVRQSVKPVSAATKRERVRNVGIGAKPGGEGLAWYLLGPGFEKGGGG